MTFRKRHWFFRRFVLSLAFAAATASPAAAMRVAEPGSTQVSSSGGSVLTDFAYGLGGITAFVGLAGCASAALRSHTGSRLALA